MVSVRAGWKEVHAGLPGSDGTLAESVVKPLSSASDRTLLSNEAGPPDGSASALGVPGSSIERAGLTQMNSSNPNYSMDTM